VAVDSKGNVYQSYIDKAGTGGGVLEFAGGKMPGKKLSGFGADIPGTLIIDKKDDIIVSDQTANTLNTYAPPYTKASSSFALQAKSIQCSINAGETDIVCADQANNTVDSYKYPAGTYQYSFDSGLLPTASTVGVAQDPSN
jgi:hypothetical protein